MALLAESRGRVGRVHTGREQNRVRFASIGPITSSTLREFGLPVDIEAAEYTIPGLIKAIARLRSSEQLPSWEAGLSTKDVFLCSPVWFWWFRSHSANPLPLIFRRTNSCSTLPPTDCGRIWRFCRTICWKAVGSERAAISWRPTYVRAQFEEMGLKPAGGNGSYFQNVRFRKIELAAGQEFAVRETQRLDPDADYREGLRDGRRSAFQRHQGRRPGRIRGLWRERARVRLRRLRRNRCAGQDRGCDLWRSVQAAVRPRRPFFVRPNRNCAWPRSTERLDFSASGRARRSSTRHFQSMSVSRGGRRFAGWMTRVCRMMRNRRSKA